MKHLNIKTARHVLRFILPLPVCIILSLVIGFTGGPLVSMELGAVPDVCGGTIYLFCGAIITGLVSIPIGMLLKSRDVFYGLNTFTFLIFSFVLISVISTAFGDGPTK